MYYCNDCREFVTGKVVSEQMFVEVIMQNELRKILRLETVTNAVIEFEGTKTALEIEMRLTGHTKAEAQGIVEDMVKVAYKDIERYMSSESRITDEALRQVEHLTGQNKADTFSKLLKVMLRREEKEWEK